MRWMQHRLCTNLCRSLWCSQLCRSLRSQLCRSHRLHELIEERDPASGRNPNFNADDVDCGYVRPCRGELTTSLDMSLAMTNTGNASRAMPAQLEIDTIEVATPIGIDTLILFLAGRKPSAVMVTGSFGTTFGRIDESTNESPPESCGGNDRK